MRNIVVLGVPVQLQGLSNDERSIADPDYKRLVEQLFSQHTIDFVFEETPGVLSSTAAKLASTSGQFIQYLGVDPHKNDRHKYGLAGDATIAWQIGPTVSPGTIDTVTTANVENLDLQAKRERHWLRRIQAQDFRNGLMICGPIHVLSLATRLIAAGFEVQALDYIPYHKLGPRK